MWTSISLFFYYKTWSIYRGLHSVMNNNKTNVQVTVIHTILRGEQRETEGEGEGEGEGGGNGPAYKSVLLHILTRINSDPKENS